jgi:hypothetical protein
MENGKGAEAPFLFFKENFVFKRISRSIKARHKWRAHRYSKSFPFPSQVEYS